MKMHLSTRWGVPSYEIESLPVEEISRQISFYNEHPWGVESGLLAWLLAAKIPKTKPEHWLLSGGSVSTFRRVNTGAEGAALIRKQVEQYLGADRLKGKK